MIIWAHAYLRAQATFRHRIRNYNPLVNKHKNYMVKIYNKYSTHLFKVASIIINYTSLIYFTHLTTKNRLT